MCTSGTGLVFTETVRVSLGEVQYTVHTNTVVSDNTQLTSVADPDPWNPYHFPGSRYDPYNKWLDPESGSGSVSNDMDPDLTKTIENIKYL